ncbi:MAG: 50S ribosomal protein L5 [bacterium]
MMSRLKDKYSNEIINSLKSDYSYKNINQVPKLVKIVVNMGVGEAIHDAKSLDNAINDMKLITGQSPIITRAKKSIAGFKLRTGMGIGCCVTLRRERMYDFLDRLLSVGLPRIKDFKGLSPKSFDGKGNYNLGLKEQDIFPEISYDKMDKVRGMNISIVTTAHTDTEARTLLDKMGVPFKK